MIFLRSWWVVAFVLACLFVYEREFKTDHLEIQRLLTLQQQLETTKAQSLLHRRLLLLQIQSQSDPRWMELVLKRSLGLVAENEIKVMHPKWTQP